MIAVERRGRLGNQLFQYAFGIAASARLGVDFAMATDELAPLFALRGARPLARARRSLAFRLRNARDPYRVVRVDEDADPETVLDGLCDHTTYAGFFQTERYFASVRDEVAAAFVPRPAHLDAFRARYRDLADVPYVCVHVRRTDYHLYDGGVVLPPSYYERALAAARAAVDGPVVVVGDDLDEVRDAFGPDVRLERNAPILDLLLMTNAAALVSSNSSFSWWGGWLGERPGRPVYAPRLWLGFRRGREMPRGVVPERWIDLPVS